MFTNVMLGRSYNNTDGAFATPATGNIADDWGPSSNDIRHRFNVNWTSQQLRNSNLVLSFNGGGPAPYTILSGVDSNGDLVFNDRPPGVGRNTARGAAPYTILSGVDSNGDLVFNDRPAGVGRNSARGAAQFNMNGFFTYSWQFGKSVTMPGGIQLRSEGGALAASAAGAQNTGRYRLSLNLNAQNLTNHANYTSYVGTITSPQFGQPLTVLNTRKIDIGMSFSF